MDLLLELVPVPTSFAYPGFVLQCFSSHLQPPWRSKPPASPWNEPPAIPSLCMTPMDRGLCRAKELRFFYNFSTGRCRPFSYSGCGGNENNFISRKSCLRTCKKGFNKKKGGRRLKRIKKKRKKQPVKALGMEIIPEAMQLWFLWKCDVNCSSPVNENLQCTPLKYIYRLFWLYITKLLIFFYVFLNHVNKHYLLLC